MSLQYQKSINELNQLIKETVVSELKKSQPESFLAIKEFFKEDITDTKRYVVNLFEKLEFETEFILEFITKLKKK